MKKILVIGAAEYQVPAIKRIKDLGYESYCVDYKLGQPGFAYANGFKVIDVKDRDACLDYAKELKIDGVMSWGSTLTLPTVSYIGEFLGVPCISMDTALRSMDKYAIKLRLAECGLNVKGKTFDLKDITEVPGCNFELPFVVKPCDGSGSKGVRLVTAKSEIEDAIQYAFDGARDNHIYVESLILGEEFSVEAYAADDSVHLYSIVKTEFNWLDDYPVYKQTTFLGIPEYTEKLIEEEVCKAVKALGIKFGPVNFDLIVAADDGKPYIIDVGIRNGQNLIASHIVPYSRGVDELNNSIELSLGNYVDATPVKKDYISSRLLIYKPGVITKIKEYKQLIGTDNIVDIILRKKEGDILNPYQTKSDICGWVLCSGQTPEDASINADLAWKVLQNYIIIE
ncbi:MAG: ATP-grasp domain-containing protein [Bacteroidales bacterium]|nr:ATP-grasp domain-containing protein [Bacteroidales bacterium]